MKLTVENYRGVNKAVIETSDRLTLIAGLHQMGKSSILQALGLALTATKPAAHDLNRNATAGSITLSDENGARSIEIPEGKSWYNDGGEPASCSRFAAGLVDLFSLEPKARAKELVEILKASPDANETAAAMILAGIHTDAVAEVVGKVFKLGADFHGDFDGVLAEYKTAGTKLKGQWERLTGKKRWGCNEGEKWKPDGWLPTIAAEGAAALAAAVTRAGQAVEKALVAGAGSAADRKILQEKAAKKEEYRADAEKWAASKEEYKAELLQAAEELKQNPISCATYECAHCGKPNQLHDDKLVKAEQAVSAEDIEAAQKLHADIKRRGNMIKAAHENAVLAYKLALQNFADSEAAERRLAEIGDAPATDEKKIAEARQELQVAQDRLRLFEAKQAADELHAAIMQNEVILKVLAPEGVRKEKLGRSLTQFNEILSKASYLAKFGKLEITADLEPEMDGKPYKSLCDSEQWIARNMIRLAVAVQEGAPIVVFDDLDRLLPTYRAPVFKAIKSAGIPAVIGCAAFERKEGGKTIPDMAKLGGVAYWINNGGAAAV